MRVDLQAKLLRVLQEPLIQRLGASTTKLVDVRIVAATAEDLETAIREKRFREDLYYRLNVVPIELPPLRERVDDIPLLVDHFLQAAATKFEREKPGVDQQVIERFQEYGWPGNVRELENCLERMLLLARGPRLTVADLPPAVSGESKRSLDPGDFNLPHEGVNLPDLEMHLIKQALERTHGNVKTAAKLLGVSYKTLQYRMRKHGFDRENF